MANKALGGIADVTIHEVLKLQLERSETGTLKIVHHSEIHAAQDFISQVPVLGKWYDGSLRSTLGQVSLAGTQLLDRAGLLDLVPTLALKTKETAQSVVNRASAVTSSAASLGSRAVNMTGVPSVVSRVFNKASGVLSEASSTAKWGASMLMESGRGTEINCYSPTCQPGRLCYSPTCPRGSNTSLLSPEALQDLVRGAYLGVFSNASTSGTS